MSQTALIIIDVQQGMFAFTEKPFDGDAILARISDMVSRAREAKVPVIFVQHDGGVGHPLERNTGHWALEPRTGYVRGDQVVEKQHPDAFQDTDLRQLLSDQAVDHVVLAGMMTEFCVDTTCRRASSLGYKVTLATDAHSTFSRDHLTAEQIIHHHNTVLGSGFATLQLSANIHFCHQEASI